MAKITRKNQLIFGSSASSGDIRQFASLAEGSPLTTTDVETIQALTRYLQGWRQALTGDDVPALEDFNALHYIQTYQLAYLLQSGMAEWNTDAIYYIGSFCQESGIIYKSLTDDNTGNQPSTDDGTNWQVFINNPVSNYNYFDNGGMQIFQRGADHTLIKDTYGFAVDRWAGMATGTAVSAGTLTQATASTLNNTGYSAKFAGITLTGTGVLYFRQRIASQTAVNLKNQIISMQYMVHHDVGSSVNYTIYVRKADALNDFTTTTNIGNSGAISVPTGTTTGTKIKYENLSVGDCSNGLEIEIKIEAGAITTKNFEISNAKLEIGTTITNFITKGYEEDLNNCQTYDYYKGALGWKGKAEDGNSGDGGYGNRGGCTIPLPKNFPKVPTVEYISGTLTIYSLTPITYNRGDASVEMDISASLTDRIVSLACRVDTARAADFATYGGDCFVKFVLLSEL